MASAVQKIKLSPSRDIPFNKLVLSQSNVRRVKAGVSIEQLAESIVQRTLLQSLNARAVVDADGNETGMFEVPAGGRRYRALELLVKQKRMAKTQPVPCVVRRAPQKHPTRTNRRGRMSADRTAAASPSRRRLPSPRHLAQADGRLRAVRQQSSFSLPDANIIVPDRNYTALADLGREDERA
jgi:hypothetical protein